MFPPRQPDAHLPDLPEVYFPVHKRVWVGTMLVRTLVALRTALAVPRPGWRLRSPSWNPARTKVSSSGCPGPGRNEYVIEFERCRLSWSGSANPSNGCELSGAASYSFIAC